MDALTGIEAVLLDLDGTLVDSDAAVERAWRRWSVEHRIAVDQVLGRAHGQPAATTVRQLRPQWPEQRVRRAAARQHALQYQDLSDVDAASGAPQLIATMARLGLAWCVVTSADGKLARLRLATAGIEPPHLFTIDDVSRGKPDPEGYLLGAATLGVPPHRCLVVEDSETGLAAGRRAGAVTASLRGLPADLPVADLAELALRLTRAHQHESTAAAGD